MCKVFQKKYLRQKKNIKIMKIPVDTDCIISLFDDKDAIYQDMQSINDLFKAGKVELFVSLKTVDQLVPRNGKPLCYSKSLRKLPNYPVGTFGDQVGTIGSLAGTFGDAKKNDELQKSIHSLTRAGVNIRDRQIIIDSYLGNMDIVLPNDRGLRDSGPAKQLKEELGIQIMSPSGLLNYLTR